MRRERALEIFNVDAVGRSHLHQRRAAACEHVGNAKAAPDLDGRVARGDHVTSLRKRVQREQQCGREIIHHEGILGAGDVVQSLRHAGVPRTARAGREIVFEVAVTAAERNDRIECGGRQRRTAEIGVQDNAGGVDYRKQRCTAHLFEPAGEVGDNVVVRCIARCARAAEDFLRRALDHVSTERRLERYDPLVGQHPVHGRNPSHATCLPSIPVTTFSGT